MRVYRIEQDGYGIFMTEVVEMAIAKVISDSGRSRHEWPEMGEFEGSENPFRHPCPGKDVPEWSDLLNESTSKAMQYYCCFESVEQLLRWFDSEAVRAAMNFYGAQMIVYEINNFDVMRGTFQCMFLKKNALQVSSGPIPTAAQAHAGMQTENANVDA